MKGNLLNLIDNFRPIKVLKVIILFPEGLHVRELAEYSKLSPSTVSDTVKILEEYKLVRKTIKGKKVIVTCNLNESEKLVIKLIIEQERKNAREKSAQALSKKAIDILKWNAEMLEIVLRAKKNATT